MKRELMHSRIATCIISMLYARDSSDAQGNAMLAIAGECTGSADDFALVIARPRQTRVVCRTAHSACGAHRDFAPHRVGCHVDWLRDSAAGVDSRHDALSPPRLPSPAPHCRRHAHRSRRTAARRAGTCCRGPISTRHGSSARGGSSSRSLRDGLASDARPRRRHHRRAACVNLGRRTVRPDRPHPDG